MKRVVYIAYLLICLLFAGSNAYAQREDKVSFNEGVEAYRGGDYEDAQSQFEAAYQRNNKNTQALYNAGNAAYLKGDFEQANTYYSDYAKAAKDPKDIAKAYYNQGNTYLQQADAMSLNPSKMSEAQDLYKKALSSFKNSLKNDPSDADAKYNLTYALSKIQQNQSQNQQDQQKQNQDQEQKEKDQQEKEQNEEENQDHNENQDNQEGNQDKGDDGDPQEEQGDQKDDNEQNENGEGQSKEEEEKEQNGQMTRAQIEQDLDAVNEEEENILKEVFSQKGDKKGTVKSGKDW